MLDEQGRIIDDVLFSRESADSFFIVPNAATTPRVVEWLEKWNEPGATIENLSDAAYNPQIAEVEALTNDPIPEPPTNFALGKPVTCRNDAGR